MSAGALPSSTALVIGSGFGGLAAAIRLAARGYRVTVLEKRAGPGGRAGVFQQHGFTFDAGPTIITAPFLLEELWTLCGRRMVDDVDLRPVDPYYRLRFDDGSWFDYSGNPARMRAEVARLSPQDVAGFERFVAEADTCYRLGFEQQGPAPFQTFDGLLAQIPAMLKMKAWRTLHGMAAQHLRDPRLRIMMSFHPLLIGGNPFAVSSIYSLITALERRFGVHWAMGGTGTLVRGLVGLLEGQGGQLRLNAEVAEITVAAPGATGGRPRATGVRLASGETLSADLVVSNADTAWTYRHLIDARHRRRWTNRRIERARHSMSLFVWYFGTDRVYPGVPHHVMLFGPRYRELMTDIFKRQVLAADFSLYLHRPTATDPAMAPPGCDAFYVLVPVPHLGSGTDWAQQAEPYRQAVAQVLDRTVLPGFQAHVVTSRVITPQHFQDDLLSYQGAAFGLEPVLQQSAWFRPHTRSEDLDGLYIVGASTHPGAGIPGVLNSARALDALVPAAQATAGGPARD